MSQKNVKPFRSPRWHSYNVAVTGMNAHADNPGPGCAVARCIRECPEFKGNIIGLSYDALDAGLYARDLCSSGHLLPYPSSGEEALLERITLLNSIERIDVIIPCLDSELANFIRIKDDLDKLGIKTLLPSRVQLNLRAKDHLADLCNSLGVKVPRGKTLADPKFFDNCESKGWKYPLIVKGIFYDASIVNNALEARAAFSRLVGAWGYPVIVQEVIKGDELDLAGVGDGTGALLGAVTMRKRALTEKGKAWAGVTVVERTLEAIAETLVDALRWRGPLEVEVIKSKNDIYVIEINPRFPSWIYLSQAVGRNLPIAVLKLLDEIEDLELAPPSGGTFFIRHARELIVELADFESILVSGSRVARPDTLPDPDFETTFRSA